MRATAEWPTANIPPAELIAMARFREDEAEACNATGQHDQARRHWIVAETYRGLAFGSVVPR